MQVPNTIQTHFLLSNLKIISPSIILVRFNVEKGVNFDFVWLLPLLNTILGAQCGPHTQDLYFRISEEDNNLIQRVKSLVDSFQYIVSVLRIEDRQRLFSGDVSQKFCWPKNGPGKGSNYAEGQWSFQYIVSVLRIEDRQSIFPRFGYCLQARDGLTMLNLYHQICETL